MRQSVYSRIAGYEDVNDAERLSQDPTFRLIGSEKIWERGAKYAIRIPANDSLERDIAELLTRPVGRPSHKPVVWYKMLSTTFLPDHPMVTACPSSVLQVLKGHTDWGPAPGQSVFTYKFQCNKGGAFYADGASPLAFSWQIEVTHEMASLARASRLVFEPGDSGAAPATKVSVSFDMARLRGTPEAPVTIIEFSDFQCPFCRKAESTLKEVLAKYEGKVSIAHRDFPLEEIHADSERASEAARCAGDQGKFWEYRNLLFSSATLDRESLAGYAGTLGLDLKDFDACISTSKYRAAVEQDVSEGKQAGVSATPTFLINGVRLTGAQPAAAFEAIIDRQLETMKEEK